ncbi:MAG: 4-alpha-glucanotransferase [Bacteroidales bacterium]|nr:4-alpha-glucanotransferase [Bacteroidales bacterium]
MKVIFTLKFNIYSGQQLYIDGQDGILPMKQEQEGVWSLSVSLPANPKFEYKYRISNPDGSVICEPGAPRAITIGKGKCSLILNDEWQGNDDTAPFLSEPFVSLFYRHDTATPACAKGGELIIKATDPLVPSNSTLMICGSCKTLGAWDATAGIPMKPSQGGRWFAAMPAASLPEEFEFKFVRISEDGNFQWEDGANHKVHTPAVKENIVAIEFSHANFSQNWPRFAGSAIPIFSLRSKKSWGIGDFEDLRLYAQWAAKCGQKIIQILPINDTTSFKDRRDSYPYNAISVMALHPLYLNPEKAGKLADKDAMRSFEKERKALNSLPLLDYDKVYRLKMRYMKALFNQEWESLSKKRDYISFYEKNKEWLAPYSAFCALRDKFKSAHFEDWEEYAQFSPEILQKVAKNRTLSAASNLYSFIQYHLDKSLTAACKEAHRLGVALKGDLPIGIAPDSVDAWVAPQLYNLDMQAGAPPDYFSADGQNWGFPTYNWDIMQQDGFSWWKKRFGKLAQYFDAYRIDHVLGFFRIWEIPKSEISGALGHFNPTLPLSVEEIEKAGFHFDARRSVTPLYSKGCIEDKFGAKSTHIIEFLMCETEPDSYTFKEKYATQRALKAFCDGDKALDEAAAKELLSMVANRLFLEDPYHPGKFNPSINGCNTDAYRSLLPGQQRAYNAIYSDYFFYRNNSFWQQLSYIKLPAVISVTNMLACAEDLGMIPDCVPQVLNELKIMTLEIQRMPKQFGGLGHPDSYPYLSVCSTGSHDTSTLRGWWREDRHAAEDCFHSHLHMWGSTPADASPEIVTGILKQHLNSPSMLAIFPLQDWMAISQELCSKDPAQDRINDPGNPNHYWRWRMGKTIEELVANDGFNEKVKALIEGCGR